MTVNIDSKVWTAEQTIFSSIRIKDELFKRDLIKSAMVTLDSERFAGYPSRLEEAARRTVPKILLGCVDLKLEPGEFLIVFKKSQVMVDGKLVEVHPGDLIQNGVRVLTHLDCGVIDLSILQK